MEVMIRKFGNSLGITFPAALAKELRFAEGKALTLSAAGQTLLLEPKQEPRYQRADLLAQCDLRADIPDDMQAWESMPPVGSEVW